MVLKRYRDLYTSTSFKMNFVEIVEIDNNRAQRNLFKMTSVGPTASTDRNYFLHPINFSKNATVSNNHRKCNKISCDKITKSNPNPI